eukprot:1082100-Lingulodinium_polyedra.AAC.1
MNGPTTTPARLNVQFDCIAVTRPLSLPGLLGERPHGPSFPRRADVGATEGSPVKVLRGSWE